MLAIFGMYFDREENKFTKALKAFTALTVLLSTFQSFLFLVTSKEFDVLTASSLTIGLADFQGCFKLITIIWNMKNLKEIKARINDLMKNLSEEQLKSNDKEFQRFYKITQLVFICYISCIWIFNVMPIFIVSYFLLTKGVFVKPILYSFWYPFDIKNYYFPVYIYEVRTILY